MVYLYLYLYGPFILNCCRTYLIWLWQCPRPSGGVPIPQIQSRPGIRIRHWKCTPFVILSPCDRNDRPIYHIWYPWVLLFKMLHMLGLFCFTTNCQDHTPTENIWFVIVWSKTSYIADRSDGDITDCRTNERTKEQQPRDCWRAAFRNIWVWIYWICLAMQIMWK